MAADTTAGPAGGPAGGAAGVPAGGDAYVGAGQHYTSPTRRDWVKRAWEEPAFARHLDAALRSAHTQGLSSSLDVLDVGCGTGVALDLLLATPALSDSTLSLARATGLDLDEGLLAIARERFADDPRMTFVTGDLTAPPATGPHDLVLSSGVPFSHLEPAELERSLTLLAADALGRDHAVDALDDGARSALLVIDVLGRYSLEWTTRWDEVRWDYRMSFFATDVDVASTPMTTWSGDDLAATIARATEQAGAELSDLALVDRSIAVGRHMMTGEYTPDLPRLRDLVDALAEPDVQVDLDALHIDLPLPDAPSDVLAFHGAFASAWNAALDGAAADATPEPILAERLRDLEAGFESAGLGVGHSLTAFALLRR
jgi:SAM-dependent methyltransferase